MAENNRSQWLQTLEIIASKPPDQAEAEWAWVMQQLGLGPEYFLGIIEAVRQGRWREAGAEPVDRFGPAQAEASARSSTTYHPIGFMAFSGGQPRKAPPRPGTCTKKNVPGKRFLDTR